MWIPSELSFFFFGGKFSLLELRAKKSLLHFATKFCQHSSTPDIISEALFFESNSTFPAGGRGRCSRAWRLREGNSDEMMELLMAF